MLSQSGCPFPDQRKSRKLRKEDLFMHVHGGSGARSIYLFTKLISFCWLFIVRSITGR